jgi:hypothetical protein
MHDAAACKSKMIKQIILIKDNEYTYILRTNHNNPNSRNQITFLILFNHFHINYFVKRLIVLLKIP